MAVWGVSSGVPVVSPDHQSCGIPVVLWLLCAWIIPFSARLSYHGTTLAKTETKRMG
jgi:hypothetical protein